MREAAAPRLPVSALLTFALLPVLFHLIILETRHVHMALAPHFGSIFKLGFVSAAALAHWGIYSSLLITFASTLRPGHEALITTMARKMQSEVPADMLRYTRRVTMAWCGFFGFQLTVSIGLFCFAPLVVWSYFVNILDIPLVVCMFTAEYFCRRHFLQNPPKHSFATIMRMVADSRSQPWQQPLPADAGSRD
jgi:uncharacterized membrane protein